MFAGNFSVIGTRDPVLPVITPGADVSRIPARISSVIKAPRRPTGGFPFDEQRSLSNDTERRSRLANTLESVTQGLESRGGSESLSLKDSAAVSPSFVTILVTFCKFEILFTTVTRI